MLRATISNADGLSEMDVDIVPTLIRSYASAAAEWEGLAKSRAYAGSANDFYLRLSMVWNGRPAIQYLQDLAHGRD